MIKEKVDKPNTQPLLIPGLIVIGLALVVRFLFLGSDPPYFFSRASQDILSDPYNYIHFARNKILFGAWEIFDYSRWIIYEYSLVTLVSYLLFLVGGVSRITANLAAIAMSTTGLVLFSVAHLRQSKTRVIVTAIILLSNMTLITFGRYPFLETGLIFFCGLIYFLFNKYYPAGWVLVVTGILLTLCSLSGKMFGMILIIPVGLAIWANHRENFLRHFGLILISTVVSFVILAWGFYGSEIGNLFGFLGEHATGMYGFPEALTSPVKFIEHLISFGRKSKLFFFSPFLLLLIIVSLTRLLLGGDNAKRETKYDHGLLFCIGWLLSGYLLLMLFNYRPLRYQLFLLMPIAGIIGYVITRSGEYKISEKPGRVKTAILFFVWWYGWAQIILIGGGYFFGLTMSEIIVWYGLPVALLTSVILYFFGRNIFKSGRLFNKLSIILLSLSIIFQSIWIYKWFDKRTYNLYEGGQALTSDIGSDAVLAGPYAQALTIDNNIRSFIYWFGMAQKEPDLFRKYPVTHIAADVSNWEWGFIDYEVLNRVSWISNYRIRDIEVRIARLPDDFLLEYKRNYQWTDYERAMRYYHLANADSCLYYINQSLAKHPKSKSAFILLANYYINQGVLDAGFAVFDSLMSYYPRDFSLRMDAGSYRYSMYRITGNDLMLGKADRLFHDAVKINPYCALEVEQLKRQTDSIYGGGNK